MEQVFNLRCKAQASNGPRGDFETGHCSRTRDLTDPEHRLRSKLKNRILGWVVIEKAKKRQCSRVTYIREGDANTKFFHLKANSRRRKNFIQRLRKEQGWAISHQDKQQIIQDHFSSVMADPPAASCDLNWDALCLPEVDLTSLDDPFIEQEVLAAIKQLPHDKAPGPNGYTGNFFKACWNIIKQDVVAAVNYFHMGRCTNLNLVQSKHRPGPYKKMVQSRSRTTGQSVSSTPLQKSSANY